MQTFEAVFEKQAGKSWELSTNVYRYNLDHLITAVPLSDGLQQFQNAAAVNSTGVELEAAGKLKWGAKMDASIAIQRSSVWRLWVRTSELAGPSGQAAARNAALRRPPVGQRRSAIHERAANFAGDSVPPVYLVNLTLASRRLPGGFDLNFGIRNLLNRRYWDPVGTNEGIDVVEQDGRSFFVRVTWGPRQEKTEAKPAPSATAQKDQP